MFIGPLIIHSVIEKYLVHGMFLLMGAVLFNVTALAMLIRPSPFSKRKETSKETESKERVTVTDTLADILHIMRNFGFMCYFFSMYAWSAAESVVMIFLPMYAEEQGSTKIQAATLFTGYGICSLISRLVIGLIAGHVNKSLLHASLLGLTAMLHLSFPSYSSEWTNQMMYSAALGLYTGGATTLLSPLTVEFLELKYLPQGFGILAMASGLAYLTVPVVSSEIVSRTGCLSYVFYLAGGMVFLGCIAALIGGVFIERRAADDHTMLEVELNDKVSHIEQLEREDLILKNGKDNETVLTGLIKNRESDVT
ncbi:hypothetical protein LOTGIDRAFT_238635 [Lottia gigantea]|uniref:Major facilitator superfamily (MFS) profile domain-containing protein n=1 Tax=Lottia gigantea TaxID=225164 RepID=V4AYN8_LOTGI|nr:hypothetical protein LOTGIDRAFT_238635 [Lottia gigantea]ESP00256.1 hypothetical protein LOTGIDRAFT_238635 [Lottia gigantea]